MKRPPSPPPHAHQFESAYEAVLFDMDGVVTDTATIHAAAWQRLFDEVLHDPRAHGADLRPFDPVEDYRLYVDGRGREDGVAAFLAARGIELEPRRLGDSPQEWSIAGLAERKNDLFLAELSIRGLRSYPGTTDLLGRLRAGGIPVGLVTASRNAHRMLAAAGLAGMFDVVVDGEIAAEQHLPGKPDPAMFLEAARGIELEPRRL
ncbi:MAG: HAD hydrolase-like protein, partial [Dietzia sp.]|nr:HAD hydrolase-like protein [Dietzia sp.]